MQPVNATEAENRGLGWNQQDLQSWLDPVCAELGRTRPFVAFEDAPPRSLPTVGQEDERVYGVLMAAKDEDASRVPILVTADGDFAREVNADAPVGHNGYPLWVAQSPTDFLNYLHAVT